MPTHAMRPIAPSVSAGSSPGRTRAASGDDGSAVKANGIGLEQVLFTSARSRMAEGYRIVGATSTVGAADRAEITRRAPSHGSLCSADPDALGLIAFPLGDGRFCVGLSQYAGVEHTARGGDRVHTHFVLLNSDAYEQFGCDATRVWDKLAAIVRGRPDMSCGPLEPLVLDAPQDGGIPAIDQRPTADCIHRAVDVAIAVLCGSRGIVCGESDQLALLRAIYLSLPFSARVGLATSAGLAFSLSRRLSWSIIASDDGSVQRSIRGQDLRWWPVRSWPVRETASFDAWAAMIEQMMVGGRFADVARLHTSIQETATAGVLARLAPEVSNPSPPSQPE